jgi:hypothetical protein
MMMINMTKKGRKSRRKTTSNATTSLMNIGLNYRGLNPRHCSKKLAPSSLSYGTAPKETHAN